MDKEKFINQVLSTGFKIASYLNNNDESLYLRHDKGFGGDISIGADLLSEKMWIEALSGFGNIDSEESGLIDNDKEYHITIDPLDGSDNFLSHIPYYGASIAINALNIGIIMNFCNLSVIIHFQGKNLKGTLSQKLNDFKEININNHSKCGIFERAYLCPHICSTLRDNQIKFRSFGALALTLSLVYDVDFVLFAGEKRKYDLEAGYLVSSKLYKIEGKNLVLISKDKHLFDRISKLLF